MIALDLNALAFEKNAGVVTVVAQDALTGAVLMVAAADREALERTIATGEMHYRSRTRGLWHKGATSGNVQRVVSLTADCDGDAVLARVTPAGPACHNGSRTCFGDSTAADILGELADVIESRAQDPAAEGYTKRLLADRNLRLKKLGEEATELAVALADEDKERAAEEGADLLYHMMVALLASGVSLNDVRRKLSQRRAQAQ